MNPFLPVQCPIILMNVSPLDLFVFVSFFGVVIGLSVWKSRRTKEDAVGSSDFFLAGRGLTWPLIGISIVAANISTEQMVGMAGQAAGSVGLAVSCWQLLGSVFIVIMAVTLLPKFLSAGIYTMPEYLEYRYDKYARAVMAIMTVIIYVVVLLPAVLYSGGITLKSITGMDLVMAVWMIGLVGAGYSAVGGLKAIAWADLVQGIALLVGGMMIFFLGLNAVGGWKVFAQVNEAKLHLVLPASDKALPWTGVLGGMWIVMIYYCGLNQYIVQRNLAAKSLKHGQLGMIFAGALWLLVPFAIVMPGMLAQQLYAGDLKTADAAFPMMVTKLIQPGLRGLIYAAIAGAVISTLASMLNSASTISTMDLYRRIVNGNASERSLVWIGRILTVVFVVIGAWVAPLLNDPKFGGVFNFIQKFQGYIWPGVVAAFVMPFFLPRVPAVAGTVALILGPLAYAAFQFTEITVERPDGLHGIHYLLQVLYAFGIVAGMMVVLTLLMPRREPSVLPVRDGLKMETEPVVKIAGAAVIFGVVLFFIFFW